MPVNNTQANVIGAEALLSAYFADRTAAYVQTQTLTAPCFGGLSFPTDANVRAGAVGPVVDIAQTFTTSGQVYEYGLYRVYEVVDVYVVTIGGGQVGYGALTCGLLGSGAVVTQPYGTLAGASTALAPSWAKGTLPTQFVVNSGNTDPCGAIGANAQYNVPSLYLATMRLPTLSYMPLTAEVEVACSLVEWYPTNHILGAQQALEAAMQTPWARFGETDAQATFTPPFPDPAPVFHRILRV